MDKHTIYLITLTTLFVISVPVLAALGEERLDVYTSIFTLEYFALSAIFRPRGRARGLLALALLIVFLYTVALRIIKILFPP
ncbi:MAG: hypothetical protein QXJ17_02810 [Nitrososphaeria archaeon]